MGKHKRFINKKYLPFVWTTLLAITLLRLFEITFIILHHSFDILFFIAELVGWLRDILAAFTFLFIYYFFWVHLKKLSQWLANALAYLVLFIYTSASFLIVKYFTYQLIPLDISLFHYSMEEVLFTIQTSSISIFSNSLLLLSVLFFLLVFSFFSRRISYKKQFTAKLYQFMFIAVSLYIPSLIFTSSFGDYFKNKTSFFLSRTIQYQLGFDSFCMDCKEVYESSDFHNMYADKKFVDENYPLLHQVKRTDSLAYYFKEFDSTPNLVILIVEGLNDDFIHEYKGAMFMPYLNQLKDKSLYWSNCLTLGERSFSVVPTLLAGLPYGKIGFTLEEKVPLHFSLASILKDNGYYTSFYEGQGAWFHNKSVFFKHNDLDLIFDKDSFSNKYSKVIVKENNFFWGYNDKDLFHQSLEVIDSLQRSPRLDIYFTGTMHTPFRIAEETNYSKRLEQLKSSRNKKFVTSKTEFLKTLLFFDDALQEFMEAHKKMSDYENTVFVITGDHPMTELPRANQLKKYHVPLLIYSPKLKRHQEFTNVVSHHDFHETMLSFLASYKNHIPSVSTSLGSHLFKGKNQKIALMNDNREIIDFYADGYFLSGKVLYEVKDNFELSKISRFRDRKKKKQLNKELNIFKQFSLSTVEENKIISKESYLQALQHQMVFNNHIDSLKTAEEYHDLIQKMHIPKRDLVLDIGLQIIEGDSLNKSIVYQIKNEQDSMLLWENMGIQNKGKLTQYHLNIPYFPEEDSLFFSCYIWNTKQEEVEFKDVEIFLRARRKK